jgi:hypothetical protein
MSPLPQQADATTYVSRLLVISRRCRSSSLGPLSLRKQTSEPSSIMSALGPRGDLIETAAYGAKRTPDEPRASASAVRGRE